MTEANKRPLSPHLTIYRPQITSVLSISHRISGFFLYLGLVIISWYIICSILGQGGGSKLYINLVIGFFSSFVGKLALFFWCLAFYYHFFNGIRHLTWDVGYGYSIKSVKITGILVILASVGMTIFSWFYGFSNFLAN